MRKRSSNKIGFIGIVLLLLAIPAGAEDRQELYEILLCRIDPPAANRLLTDSLHLPPTRVALLAENQRHAPSPPRVRLESSDSLTALNFSNSGFISPYIGAGIGHDEPPIHVPGRAQTLTMRLGAGFGCKLDALTRLFFNYTFQFLPDSTPDANSRPDEAHNISLGLQFTF
jgi:hypothetical protein